MASLGAVQIVGLTYAQMATPSDMAALLLALRLAQVITLLAQPPFYARIPQLVHLWSSGRREKFLQSSQIGMRYSLYLVVVGFAITGYAVPIILELLGSDVKFVNSEFWSILFVAYFLERYGAMHIQIHSMNNVVVWHWANGIAGTIFILANVALYSYFGILALPIALLTSNSIFFVWYCGIKSFRLTKAPFFRFEAGASLGPILLMLICAAMLLNVG
jgi:uncharacterized membrane protein YdcZ (DUF606 family)